MICTQNTLRGTSPVQKNLKKEVRGTFCFYKALKNSDMVLLLFSESTQKRVYGTFAAFESPQKTAIWYLVNGKTSKKVQRWYLAFYCIKSVHLCHSECS